MFKIKIVSADKSFSWMVLDNKFQFTKSKCDFMVSCAIKNNYFPGCSFELVGE